MINVSIHAPVMDANGLTKEPSHSIGVSIHAPVMDAKSNYVSLGNSQMFQSTRP